MSNDLINTLREIAMSQDPVYSWNMQFDRKAQEAHRRHLRSLEVAEDLIDVITPADVSEVLDRLSGDPHMLEVLSEMISKRKLDMIGRIVMNEAHKEMMRRAFDKVSKDA